MRVGVRVCVSSVHSGYFLPGNEMNCGSLRDAALGTPSREDSKLFFARPLLFIYIYIFVFFFSLSSSLSSFTLFFSLFFLFLFCLVCWLRCRLYNEPCVSSCIVMATGSGCRCDLPVTKRPVLRKV